MVDVSALNNFISVIEQKFPAIKIQSDHLTCHDWSTATFPTTGKTLAILSPSCVEEVRAIVQLAVDYNLPFYPISGGKNWGYGSRAPKHELSIAINLENINCIQNYDKVTGTISVEAGVTYAQLQQFLYEQPDRWRFNGPGSSPFASVLANTLERGLNQGVQMEHWRSIVNIEVVLPCGELVRVGASGGDRGLASGPNIGGLFSQNDMGIVTSMTVCLDPLPNYWQHLHFSWLDQEYQFANMVDRLQMLHRKGLFATSLAIHNLEKIISVTDQYPYIDSHGTLPLPASVKQQYQTELGGDWFGEVAIAAPTAHILDMLREEVNKELDNLPLICHWGEKNAQGPYFHDFTQGSHQSMYWRKLDISSSDNEIQKIVSISPERDGCGVIWLAVTMPWNGLSRPITGSDTNEPLYEFIVRTCYEAGFEPFVSMQYPNHRYGYMVISIIYDRDQSGQDQAAVALYYQLKESLEKQDYVAYRSSLLDDKLSRTDKDLLLKYVNAYAENQ